jgi:hypothetical protein
VAVHEIVRRQQQIECAVSHQIADIARVLRPKLKVPFIIGYADNAFLN